MKAFAIKRAYGFLEIDALDKESEDLQERIEGLDRAIKDLHEAHGFRYICGDTRFISSEKMSVRLCESCQNLMINRDKNPAGFDQSEFWRDATLDSTVFISNGGTLEGKELCGECLPSEHRWGLFS